MSGILANWLVGGGCYLLYNTNCMIFAFAILAAMTRMGDLAEVVKTDILPPCREFCVTGTVSYVLMYQENYCHVLAEDGGIGVDITGSFAHPPIPIPGDVVRFDGAMMPRGADSIQPEFRRLEIVGHIDPPAPAKGPAAEIMSGRHDFRRALLVGEVRDVEPSGTNPCWNYLSIINEGQQYYAPIPVHGASLKDLEALIGSTVRLDGFPDPHNCSYRFLDERRFLVAGMDNVEILVPPPKDQFSNTPSVVDLRHLAPETISRLGRHKAAGRLLSIWQGHNALLKMHDSRIAAIAASEPISMRRGDHVEVIGYPSTDGFTLRLSRAILRPAHGETAFAETSPRVLSEGDIASLLSDDILTKDTLQGCRVRICGTVADFGDRQRDEGIFLLSIAGRLLEIDFSPAPEAIGGLETGCRVQVTGTCVLDTENWATFSSGVRLLGIRVVVDQDDDLEILSYPPWWTPARLTAVVAILALTLFAILVWNRMLHKLSEKRGRELFQERTASALAELKTSERTRLAAEIHDSISQILTGAAMQLDAGETGAAKRILASCRRVLRCCLWDLRSHALDAQDFADAVRETLAPHLGGINAVVDFDIPSAKLSEALRHAALSIIREATVNAVRHGRAGTIAISGELDGHRLSFTVVDDGRGFDPGKAKGTDEGHFGLLGMRERVKAFNGTMAITSSPGNGTEISVVMEDAKDGTDESERQEP